MGRTHPTETRQRCFRRKPAELHSRNRRAWRDNSRRRMEGLCGASCRGREVPRYGYQRWGRTGSRSHGADSISAASHQEPQATGWAGHDRAIISRPAYWPGPAPESPRAPPCAVWQVNREKPQTPRAPGSQCLRPNAAALPGSP
jgi:hypothetical protein